MEKKLELNKDLIAFRKNLIICNKECEDIKNMTRDQILDILRENPFVVGLQIELMNLGFRINPQTLLCLNDEEAIRISKNILPFIKELIGAGHDWKPLYEGFPAQVKDMSELELFVDQIIHYLSCGTWMPSYPQKYKELKQMKAYENPSYVELGQVSDEEFLNIFYNIVGSKNSITQFDRTVIEWFLEKHKNGTYDLDFDIEIPFKENLCILLNAYPDFIYSAGTNVNDILRSIVYVQGGDITLPKIPKDKSEKFEFHFKKMKRPQRKYFLNMIEIVLERKSLKNVVCDMRKYKGRWIRLAEILHPGDYASLYPQTFKAFNELRNNVSEFRTWNSEVMDLYRKLGSSKDTRKIIDKVSERPGEFIRRFDSLWRRSNEVSREFLIKTLFELDGASTKVLIELFNHIDRRKEEMPRLISIPNSRKRHQLETLAPLSKEEIDSIKGAIYSAMMKNFSKKGSMKDNIVVIDDLLKGFGIPSDMRTISEGKLVLPKGSKIPFAKEGPNKEKVIRFYTHWVDNYGSIDLDLHACFVSEDYKKIEHIGWNADYSDPWAVFSGDVRKVIGDCAEYIDINIEKALQHGFRYVVMNVNSYECQSFNSMKAYVGFTYRKRPEQGTTWVPNQVVQSFQLQSDALNICAAIVDLKKGHVIVCDTDWDGAVVSNTPANTDRNIVMCKFFTHDPELNLHKFIVLNAMARGAKEIISQEEYHKRMLEYAKATPEEEQVENPFNAVVYTAKEFSDDYTKILNLL